MKIETKYIQSSTGHEVIAVWEDCDVFPDEIRNAVRSVTAICFSGESMVLVKDERGWHPASGGREEGETPEETLIREVKEESNMKILKYIPLGFMKTDSDGKIGYQARYYCEVEPYGPFVSDPAGDVTEIKLIDKKDYKKDFDWGVTFERIMERVEEIRGNKKI